MQSDGTTDSHLQVNAITAGDCIDGPSAALTAFLGVRAHYITCGFDHALNANQYLIYPAENYETVCAESADLLNARLGGASFFCTTQQQNSSARAYSWLYVNATECGTKVAALNTALFGACDFETHYIPDWAVGWNAQGCEPLTVCAPGGAARGETAFDAPATVSVAGCWDANTETEDCAGYQNCGYTCVGVWCGHAGSVCPCSCDSCAVYHGGWVLDLRTARCIDPAVSHNGSARAIGEYQVDPPTYVTDRTCAVCGVCGAGVAVATACTPTSDTVCGNATAGHSVSPSSSSSSLSTFDVAMVVLAGLVVVVIISALLHRQRGLTRKTEQFAERDALQERLLEEAQGDLEESQAMNTRMRGAWQIAEEDVVMDAVPLASGAFGAVHAGRYSDLPVAVKVIFEPLEDDIRVVTGSSASSVALDFARECETLMATRHKHLLIFYGAGVRETDSRPFLVIEFMALGSLKAVLADTEHRELGWPVRTRIAAQIASGMAYLHEKQIVHRDLKSDNCLLNEALNVKVADFGTSKLVTSKRAKLRNVETQFGADGAPPEPIALTATMTRGVGTPLWMAPELFVVGSTYGPKVDVYSFGIILWELATRREPWDEIKNGGYLDFYTTLCDALQGGQRPQLAVEVAQQHPEFVALMQECWATAPGSRPGFEAVVILLAAQAAV